MIKLTKELTFKLKNFEGDFKFAVGIWKAKLYYNSQIIKPAKKSFGKLIFNVTNQDGNIEEINISSNSYNGTKVVTAQETIVLEKPLSIADVFLSFIPIVVFLLGTIFFGAMIGLLGGLLGGLLIGATTLIGAYYVRDAANENIGKKNSCAMPYRSNILCY